MGATPVLALPVPELTETADGPDAFNDLALRVEAALRGQQLIPAQRVPQVWAISDWTTTPAGTLSGDLGWNSATKEVRTYKGATVGWRLTAPHTVASAGERDALQSYDGMQVYRTDIHQLEVRRNGSWAIPGALGVIAIGNSTASAATSATAEARLAGPQNISARLYPGRVYGASLNARMQANGGGGSASLVLRSALGVTPTTASAAVWASRHFLDAAAAAGQQDTQAGLRPFQVTTSGDWTFHVFGVVNASASMTGVGFVTTSLVGSAVTAVQDLGALETAVGTVPTLAHAV